MHDLQTAGTPVIDPAITRRADYRPPDWLVSDVALDFTLDAATTRVLARLTVVRNGDHDRPLRLDGAGAPPLAVTVDGAPAAWQQEGAALTVALDGDRHVVETEVEIEPDRNTELMGLYASGANLCTQCEAQGFRRITWFPDRPDILSRYRVRLTADRRLYPVLLANGDPVAAGDLRDGRHWAEWNDPFPKPCYLFALVAGDLAANRGQFVTASGRTVALAIWVRPADIAKTQHALDALGAAMAWDEAVYGREYDLDVFNIVAVDDFNFGAMENKGLNVFNSRYILADPDTATDADFDAIAAVVAHEYFHNWSGNRVTCRDWFQLSLKEGFTVYRDQCFSADQGSAAVKRIEDVRTLRAAQFPEDAGPLAHPIRPESYLEISNFYTATIYNKGAEVVRMLATLLGRDRFRAGTDLYFDRFDGTAATCEDFVACMEQAGGRDLAQFRLWYSQAGTPRLTAALTYDADGGRAALTIAQTIRPTPGQSDKAAMVLPIRLKLFGAVSARTLVDDQMIVMTDREQRIDFGDIGERPILSINRGFSAPVIVDSNRSADDLAFLSRHDDDPFARYEAMQQMMLDTLVAAVSAAPPRDDGDADRIGSRISPPGAADHRAVVAAVAGTLEAGAPGRGGVPGALDPAFIAEAVLLPSEAFIGDQIEVVDPAAIFAARDALRRALGRGLDPAWRAAFAAPVVPAARVAPAAPDAAARALSAAQKGSRRLKNVALGYIAASGAADAAALAFAQFDGADNMTDRQAALAVLVAGDSAERVAALDIFYNRYSDNALVLDKWFSAQALSPRDDTPAVVEELARHPDFALTNPNRARALIGAFSANQRSFHDASGRGYRFVADQLIALDRLNPQTAAKLVPPLGRWRRFEPRRAALMRTELERIVGTPGVSRDMYEQASKSLDG